MKGGWEQDEKALELFGVLGGGSLWDPGALPAGGTWRRGLTGAREDVGEKPGQAVTATVFSQPSSPSQDLAGQVPCKELMGTRACSWLAGAWSAPFSLEMKLQLLSVVRLGTFCRSDVCLGPG